MHQSTPFSLLATFPLLTAALWPAPQSVSYGPTVLRLASNFSYTFDGNNIQQCSDLKTAATESQDRILTDNLQILQPDRGAGLSEDVKGATELASVKLAIGTDCGDGELVDISKEAIKPINERDEAYQLDIQETDAVITACSALGLFRGMTTFEQLVYALPPDSSTHQSSKRKRSKCSENSCDTTRFIQNTPISIKDEPAFPWRGILMDTSRNFFEVCTIKKNILAASFAKLSVFYWHITDSQSFPLELRSDGLAKITQFGAYDSSSIYSQSQIAEIIAYANRLGIDIVFEIDSPGHTASIGYAYPDLIACQNESPWATYAAEPQSGQINIAKPEAVSLAQSIYAELGSITNSPFISTGGDEVNAACYELPEVADLLNCTIEEALKDYTTAIHGTIRDASKTPVVWEEQVLDHDVGIAGTDVPVIVWVNSTSVEKVAKTGNPIIHAASDYFYLDCGAGGWVGDFLGQSWCPYVSWQQTYSFNPVANMTEEQSSRVLGGQAQVWAEQTDDTNIEDTLWPRAGALSEVFWTGQAESRNASEALQRLHDWRYRLVERDIRARPLQPHWCALRPNACDLTA